jgi:hypothetical protein
MLEAPRMLTADIGFIAELLFREEYVEKHA